MIVLYSNKCEAPLRLCKNSNKVLLVSNKTRVDFFASTNLKQIVKHWAALDFNISSKNFLLF